MPTEKPRYTVIVDDEMLKRIDDFRFENRYPSRSAATLELIRLGLEALERKQTKEKRAQIKDSLEQEADTVAASVREQFLMEKRAEDTSSASLSDSGITAEGTA